jgi:cytochrome b pre-mRNA-processing protein 3
MVRLERDGPAGEQTSVALTERLVESLDTEIREMGVGDPTLGKQVRKLVGAVSARVDRWRALLQTDADWTDEIRRSMYLDEPANPNAVTYSESELRRMWRQFNDASIDRLSDGRLG